jgi:FHA domain
MQSIELNDRNLAVAVDGELRTVQPSGLATAAQGAALQGAAAWTQLRRAPSAVSTRHFSDLARHRATPATFELAVRELRELARGIDAPPLVALAARFDQRALGELLSIARAANVEVAGFIDAAVVNVARLASTRSALVLDCGLYESSVTLVDATSGARMRRSAVAQLGYMDLLERWLQLAAEAMVKRTRFDPLHDGGHEQQIFDALPDEARSAQRDGSAIVRVRKGDEEVQVQLALDQFANAAAPVYAELQRVLQELRPPGALLDLVVPAQWLTLPGFVASFASFSGCELIGIEDGFAARGASLLPAPASSERDSVSYFKRLPPDSFAGVAAAEGCVRRGAIAAGVGRSPTHLLFAGNALPILEQPLVIGRAPGDARGLALPEGLAGVSRRHCSLLRDGSGAGAAVLLIDHSSHGSYLNGERVQSRARLAAGDRLRIGTPGVELSLIRVDAG